MTIDFETVSQIAHILTGALLVILSAYLLGSPIYGLASLLGWALVKEFWWDPTYEPPDISGGLAGSVRDFAYYMLGGGIGCLLVWLKPVIAYLFSIPGC